MELLSHKAQHRQTKPILLFVALILFFQKFHVPLSNLVLQGGGLKVPCLSIEYDEMVCHAQLNYKLKFK